MGHGVNGVADLGAASSSPSEPADAALLAAIARGERDAFVALYARHAPWLQVRLRRRCGDPDAVAEALQDTFVAVWRGSGRWGGRGEVPAWLWGIAVRRLINVVSRRPHHEPLTAVTDPVISSAEEQVLLGVEYGDAAGALNRLSSELQVVVRAVVLDGLTTREAARLLHIPQGTVKTRMARARNLLRQALS
jgi:RNA polymerase sigma-70 factor (ECF subfamily)